jgi:hypothetical protein
MRAYYDSVTTADIIYAVYLQYERRPRGVQYGTDNIRQLQAFCLQHLVAIFKMDTKEAQAVAEPAPAGKASLEKEFGVAQHKADELGIEMGHVKEVKGVDKMFAYASVDAISIDEATNRRLVRKIDSNVLPWLCVLYILQYLDKGV